VIVAFTITKVFSPSMPSVTQIGQEIQMTGALQVVLGSFLVLI
jgi:hypothetical protein